MRVRGFLFCTNNIKCLLKQNKGLTFMDLMVGLAVLMVGIVFLGVAHGFVNYSSGTTRHLMAMENIANDVAEIIQLRAQDENLVLNINEVEDWGSRQDVRYKVVVTTGSGMNLVRMADLLERYDITVYHQDEDEDVVKERENEDDEIYRLSIFVRPVEGD